MSKKGLGKGLGALIDDGAQAEASREVQIEAITPNPYQPRQDFDPQRLAELVDSVKEHGVLQPLLVRRLGPDRFELIAGERRFRAAREAGLTTVPALVRECTDTEMLELAIIENVQREDINPVEAAHAYRRLMTEFGMTQEDVARRVGKARPTVANTLRLLALQEPIVASIRGGEITEAHARYLLQAPEPMRLEVWEQVRKRGLTVKETDALVRRAASGKPTRTRTARSTTQQEKDPFAAALEEALETALGTRVRIRPDGATGKIEIEYYSPEELEGIVDRILN
jgi:ParB family chromosome partitioning protein